MLVFSWVVVVCGTLMCNSNMKKKYLCIEYFTAQMQILKRYNHPGIHSF